MMDILELNEMFEDAEVSVEDAGAVDMDSEIIDLSDDDLDELNALDENHNFGVDGNDDDTGNDVEIAIDDLDIVE